MDDERRVPPFAMEALDALREPVAASDDGLPIAEATELLSDDERFTEADAEYALNLLQNRGYIYYVDDRVRITPDDE